MNTLSQLEAELNERIGIDRSVLYDFTLESLDTDRLLYLASHKTEKQWVDIGFDDNSPVVMSDGMRLGRLIIKDWRIGKLSFSFTICNLDGTYGIRTALEMLVSDDGCNLQNLDTEGYKARISDVFGYLESQYGIVADYSTVRIRRLELNATFFLEEAFERYRYPILMIARNVSPKRFGKGDQIKYASWHGADMAAQTDRLETVLIKNNSVELKIYNKGKWMRDKGIPLAADRDILRLEYTVKDSRLLEKYFGSNAVSSLSDDKIAQMFKAYFQRDVVTRYYQWSADNIKQLAELIDKHRKAQTHWVGSFLRECRQYNEVHGLPLLFDLEDVRQALKLLEPGKGRNVTNKYRRFLRQAMFEKDLLGNTRRIREIINKIMSL